jgi:hypothetical protein
MEMGGIIIDRSAENRHYESPTEHLSDSGMWVSKMIQISFA